MGKGSTDRGRRSRNTRGATTTTTGEGKNSASEIAPKTKKVTVVPADTKSYIILAVAEQALYLPLRRLDTLGSRSSSLSQKIIDKLAWREDMAFSRKKAKQKQNKKDTICVF